MIINVIDVAIFSLFIALFFVANFLAVTRVVRWTRKRDIYYQQEIENNREFLKFVKETSDTMKEIRLLIKTQSI